MSEYHIAQINIGRAVGALDGPIMAEFMQNLEPINALAEQTAGFVWRLQADDGNATSIRVFEDESILINMSVWESVEALREFTYFSQHTDFLRRRHEWFERMGTPIMVLWWVPAGHIPSAEEAKERLSMLEKHGPTPLAFTFKQPFTVDQMLAHTAEAR